MVVFVGTLLVLCAIAACILRRTEQTAPGTKNSDFERLQRRYLIVYYLATFSDWLQGPYVYKLYSDYGYDEDAIAVLYTVGFASSSLFGTAVGHAADKYGRKMLCASFGLLYTLCCLTKVSSRFGVLLAGRIFGGVSTSILFSTFEAWYVNEHLNYYKLPPEWLNLTFGKAAFYTGLLAIVAGIVSQFLAETLGFGSVSPFLLAVPFLLASTYMVCATWQEHSPVSVQKNRSVRLFSTLELIFCKETVLALLGLVQSMYESVMYVFIFSWTPILKELDPPLGLVFSIFMVAFMIGTKIYALLLSKRHRPENILTFVCAAALLSFVVITAMISSPLYTNRDSVSYLKETKVPLTICFFCFVLYEMCIGLYFPAVSYLRGRVIPEKYRASVTNWFRVPMNIFTCFALMLKYKGGGANSDSSDDYKFPLTFFMCSLFLMVTTFLSSVFSRKYSNKIKDESTETGSRRNSDDSVKSTDIIQVHKQIMKPTEV